MRGFIAFLLGFFLLVPLITAQAQSLEWQQLNEKAIDLYMKNEYGQAVPFLKEALVIAENEASWGQITLVNSLTNLAILYRILGKYAEAEPLYKRALAIEEKASGPDHVSTAVILTSLGNSYEAQGKYAEAEPLYKRALAIKEKAFSPDYYSIAVILTNLGDIYKAQGKYADAEPSYKRALAIKEKVLGPDHYSTAVSLTNLGNIYEARRKYAEAEPLYKRAWAIEIKNHGEAGGSGGKGLAAKPNVKSDEKPGRRMGEEIFSSMKLKEYKAVLGADASIKMPGLPGELRVWIGGPNFNPILPGYMLQAMDFLPAIGETAKITPFAPAFEVEPKESICVAIDLTGSAVRFTLKPKKIGTFNVGADVQLFGSKNCSGAPVPKATKTLQVQVVVDADEKLQERTKQLGDIFWAKLLDFWGVFVALVFALLLFLIRGRLKNGFRSAMSRDF